MWKSMFVLYVLGATLLVGCNDNNDNNTVDDTQTPMEEVERGMDNIGDDLEQGVDDTFNSNQDQQTNDQNQLAPNNGGVNGTGENTVPDANRNDDNVNEGTPQNETNMGE